MSLWQYDNHVAGYNVLNNNVMLNNGNDSHNQIIMLGKLIYKNTEN